MTYWNNLADKNFSTYDEVKNYLRDNISKWWAMEDNENLCEKLINYVSNLTDTEFLEMIENYDPVAYDSYLDEYIDDVAFHTTFKEEKENEED